MISTKTAAVSLVWIIIFTMIANMFVTGFDMFITLYLLVMLVGYLKYKKFMDAK